MLQVARFLLKSYNRLLRGSKKSLGESVEYIKALEEPCFTLDTDSHAELRKP